MCPPGTYSVAQNSAEMHQNTYFSRRKKNKKFLGRGYTLSRTLFPWRGDTLSHALPLNCPITSRSCLRHWCVIVSPVQILGTPMKQTRPTWLGKCLLCRGNYGGGEGVLKMLGLKMTVTNCENKTAGKCRTIKITDQISALKIARPEKWRVSKVANNVTFKESSE